MALARIRQDDAAMLVVDMQEKLLPAMHNAREVEAQTARLLDGGAVLGLPVLYTEQYPRGLGRTVPAIAQRLGGAVFRQEKLAFSACSAELADKLRELGRPTVLVAGIEAHVCVLQTCLDLQARGFTVALVADAVGSRRVEDQQAAVQRMVQAGVAPTTVEAALFEMLGQAGTEAFKRLLAVVK